MLNVIRNTLQLKGVAEQQVIQGLDTFGIRSTTDLDGKITSVNENFCRISKYARSELIGCNHRILNSGTHPKEFYKKFWQTILSGNSWRGEICNRAKDGALYWLDAMVFPVLDRRGRVSNFIFYGFDITERRLAQAELYSKQEQLRIVLASSEVGVWDWDLLTNQVRFDEIWCRQLGLDHAKVEMNFNTWHERVHPEDLEYSLERVRLHIEGESDQFENVHRLRHQNGSWLWILAKGKIIERDASGKPTRFVGTHLDVSRAKEVELQYKRSLDENKAILRSAKFSIITTDKSGLITGFNDEAERILGYRADDVIGKLSLDSLHDQEELAKAAKHISDEFGKEMTVGFSIFIHMVKMNALENRQWTYIGNDGWRTQVRLNLSALFDEHRNVSGYMGIAQDITEEIAANELIEQQRVKLIASAKMASLGEMAAGIAHEVNNPISIIAGTANLLLQNIELKKTLNTEALKKKLDIIVKSAFRVAEIIVSMKALSRAEGSQPKQNLALEPIINEVLNLCRERFRVSGVNLLVDLAPNLTVYGTSLGLLQVLTNLLNNAYDAVEPLGEKWVKIEARINQNGKIEILVIDSGRGIPPEVRPRLSQPFFSTKEVGKGTGLGLSISKQIISGFGGQLYLDSSADNTTFVIVLDGGATC